MKSPSDEAQPDIIVAKGEWVTFLSSLERLMALHRRTIQRLRDLKIRNRALQEELRSAMALPTIKVKEAGPSTEGEVRAVQLCRFCGREIDLRALFCDSCGKPTAPRRCMCGRELIGTEKFCDSCGRPISSYAST